MEWTYAEREAETSVQPTSPALSDRGGMYDIDEATASKAICLAKKMITKMTDVLGCDGYNIVQNNEEAAGQTVFHFHMHLIPRYKNDNVGLGWHMGELTEEDKKEILEKLK